MSAPLTTKQQAVLDYIIDMIAAMGYPPTRAEIASNFGWKSENAAECHIAMLRQKGYLETDPGSARGIRVVGQRDTVVLCPHCNGLIVIGVAT